MTTSSLPSVDAALAQLAALNISLPPGRVQVDGYGDSPELSQELLALIRQGKKRAGTGLLWAYEADKQPVPATGDIEIVVNHRFELALVTRLTRVVVVPFCAVTAEYAGIEAEGDGSLAHWRQAHWVYFARECLRVGREPAETMPVICCVFEVLIDLGA